MARGSIQLRHRKACGAKGKDNRACRCAPTVYAVLDGEWARIGYLAEGWRKADLRPFERILRRAGVVRDDKLKLITEAEHLHSTDPEHAEVFDQLCCRLGVGEFAEWVNG